MTTGTVHVIDDDAAVRDSIALLLRTAGLEARCHRDAEAFLAALEPGTEGCLLLDVRMPGMTGPELQEELARRGCALPVIFLTAYGDVPVAVRAMKAGAMDFLTKPVDGRTLVEHVRVALERPRGMASASGAPHQDLLKLTSREREVLALALSGQNNKQIARRLAISYRTVELHRSHILQKTGKQNMLELAQTAAESGFLARDIGAL